MQERHHPCSRWVGSDVISNARMLFHKPSCVPRATLHQVCIGDHRSILSALSVRRMNLFFLVVQSRWPRKCNCWDVVGIDEVTRRFFPSGQAVYNPPTSVAVTTVAQTMTLTRSWWIPMIASDERSHRKPEEHGDREVVWRYTRSQ